MALLGPMVVVAEHSAAELVEVLRKAGAFPIVDASWAEAPRAIAEIQPAALLLAETRISPDAACRRGGDSRRSRPAAVRSCRCSALVDKRRRSGDPDALPIALDEPASRLVARLRSALRVRTPARHDVAPRGRRAVAPNGDAALPTA